MPGSCARPINTNDCLSHCLSSSERSLAIPMATDALMAGVHLMLCNKVDDVSNAVLYLTGKLVYKLRLALADGALRFIDDDRGS